MASKKSTNASAVALVTSEEFMRRAKERLDAVGDGYSAPFKSGDQQKNVTKIAERLSKRYPHVTVYVSFDGGFPSISVAARLVQPPAGDLSEEAADLRLPVYPSRDAVIAFIEGFAGGYWDGYGSRDAEVEALREKVSNSRRAEHPFMMAPPGFFWR